MEKRPFIIDCDTGTDDAIAILAALGSDAIRRPGPDQCQRQRKRKFHIQE